MGISFQRYRFEGEINPFFFKLFFIILIKIFLIWKKIIPNSRLTFTQELISFVAAPRLPINSADFFYRCARIRRISFIVDFPEGKATWAQILFHISYFYSHIELRPLYFYHMFWNTLYVRSYGEACRYGLERTFNTPLILIRLGERVSGNTHDIKV